MFRSLSARGMSTGTRTVTVVPLPGELEICTLPPQNCARSFMPRSPKDPREFEKSDSQKPIPSSSTTSRMFSSSWHRVNAHRLCLRVPNHVGQTLLERFEKSQWPGHHPSANRQAEQRPGSECHCEKQIRWPAIQ